MPKGNKLRVNYISKENTIEFTKVTREKASEQSISENNLGLQCH